MTQISSPRPPTLVYTGKAGNIFTWIPAQNRTQQLTWSWEDQQNALAEQAPVGRLTYTWPTWAQDGSRIVCFGFRGTGPDMVETSVFSFAADGVESWELAGFSGKMPIYGNWSPRGDAFAALVQQGEQTLSLEIIRFDGLGKTIPLLSGAPLFWSWSPRGDRLAVHVGGSRRASAEARVIILDAMSGQTVQLVTDRPGEFRVPAWAPHDDLLAYVEQDAQGHDTLLLLDVATGEKGPVAEGEGGMAVVWSPDGNTLAFAHAARPGSSLFAPIRALDLVSGKIDTLLEVPVAGFFWSPQNEALLYVSLESERNYLRWHRLLRSSGETSELARFLPSREQMFVLLFFDQYTLSHPPLAPDGKTLAFAGYLISPSSAATAAQVYLLPLDRIEESRPIATGDFACWNLTNRITA